MFRECAAHVCNHRRADVRFDWVQSGSSQHIKWQRICWWCWMRWIELFWSNDSSVVWYQVKRNTISFVFFPFRIHTKERLTRCSNFTPIVVQLIESCEYRNVTSCKLPNTEQRSDIFNSILCPWIANFSGFPLSSDRKPENDYFWKRLNDNYHACVCVQVHLMPRHSVLTSIFNGKFVWELCHFSQSHNRHKHIYLHWIYLH